MNLPRSVLRYRRTAIATFVAIVAVMLLAALFWPGASLPTSVLIGGLALAVVVPIAVSWALARWNPCFSSRADVEDTLQLPVLATCRARHDI